MQDTDSFPAGLAVAMLGGAIFAVPILGWWPLVGIAAAVIAAQYVADQLQ